jgi:predicted  nucleic acid-binding Zn-ribbon protein
MKPSIGKPKFSSNMIGISSIFMSSFSGKEQQNLKYIYEDIEELKQKYELLSQNISQLLSLNQKVDFMVEEIKRISVELNKVSDILIQQATIKKEIEMLDYRTRNELSKDLQILGERIKHLEEQTQEIKSKVMQNENKFTDLVKAILLLLLGFMIGLFSKLIEKFMQ